jgi:enoyl-[acyl-carrier protein] reductase I
MLKYLIIFTSIVCYSSFLSVKQPRHGKVELKMQGDGLKIDMRGKTVFIGGVADSTGYGWAIAKACAEAGAKILLGTWPPVMPIFQMGIERGQFVEDQKLSNGIPMEISKVFSFSFSFFFLRFDIFTYIYLIESLYYRYILWMLHLMI